MSPLTIELPETLSLEVQRNGVSLERLEQAVSNFVKIYLQEVKHTATAFRSEWSDGATFARRVIANNRELFEELAHL
ncbi:MAG: hypothetical protein CVU38_07515 [Chloroflexi bacterium HGW-Chloroflexi-1]|nr:MAG: hypothetical protein CVU38_07515 [Chloroflexi bacterium HGW-Chloroflexi-1]